MLSEEFSPYFIYVTVSRLISGKDIREPDERHKLCVKTQTTQDKTSEDAGRKFCAAINEPSTSTWKRAHGSIDRAFTQ